MNSRRKLSGLLLAIVGMAIVTILMWTVSLFLGVIALLGVIVMVLLLIAVAIEPKE